jgi:hypothetical protein
LLAQFQSPELSSKSVSQFSEYKYWILDKRGDTGHRSDRMSQSLAPECTQLKHAYDSCFNNWFASYLQPQSSSGDETVDKQRQIEAQVKNYEEKCGKVWEEYKDCLLASGSSFVSPTIR